MINIWYSIFGGAIVKTIQALINSFMGSLTISNYKLGSYTTCFFGAIHPKLIATQAEFVDMDKKPMRAKQKHRDRKWRLSQFIFNKGPSLPQLPLPNPTILHPLFTCLPEFDVLVSIRMHFRPIQYAHDCMLCI